jgi:peptidoglycan/LPS O-acetylase OafA/YrhL
MPAPTARTERIVWLDGVRGAAAMFVVVHHVWLASWPSYPKDDGPWWLGGLLYGQLAVAVFIVVSGFSLALAPMRDEGRLRHGKSGFLRRRAWRILPAYWAALVVSTVITALVLRPDLGVTDISKAFAVHGLLLQDVVGSQSPNGAFWSIAIEWQIYFLFPLILWLGRKRGLEAAVLCTVAVVFVAHLAAGVGGRFSKIDDLTPQFLALFALGILAVKLGRTRTDVGMRRGIGALAVVALLAVVVGAIALGSVWMVGHFFWVDLVFGLAAACGLYVLSSGGAGPLRRVLGSRTMLRLGLFSYSIYLLHSPILGVLNKDVVGPMDLSPLARFGVLIAIGVPLVLGLCYAFHLVFEAPFLRHRGMSAFREIPGARRLWRGRGPVPLPSAPAQHQALRPLGAAPAGLEDHGA